MMVGRQTEVTANASRNSRLQALASLHLMDTPPEERFDRITRMAREIFGVPIAAVNLLDDTHLFNKSPQPHGRVLWPRDQTFCNVTIEQDGPVVVSDATEDPRFAELPDVTAGRGVRFYAGRPLHAYGGQRVGTFCLYDVIPRKLDQEQRRTFEELSLWAEHELQDSAERDRAHQVQQALLPTSSGAAGYELAGVNLPCRSVGGDFYTWRESKGRVDLTLVDVMGKGTAAALMAATIRVAVRAAFSAAVPGNPAEILDGAAQTVSDDLDATGVLATAIQAAIDTDSGEITYADAGHGLSLIVDQEGNHRRLPAAGLPLGVGDPGSWASAQAQLEPGDTFISFTDGLLDLYGGTIEALDHVAGIVHAARNPGDIMTRLQELTDGLMPDDDLTAVAIMRTR